MRTLTGSRPAGGQGKKGKNAQGGWMMWRRKRERNGGRGRRESAKRQRAMKSSFIHVLFSVVLTSYRAKPC